MRNWKWNGKKILKNTYGICINLKHKLLILFKMLKTKVFKKVQFGSDGGLFYIPTKHLLQKFLYVKKIQVLKPVKTH